MKLKRILATALSATLLAGVALASGGNMVISPKPVIAEKTSYEVVRRNDDASVMVWGSVMELGENTIYLENGNEKDPNNKILVRVSETTAVLDAVTGEIKTFADIRQNENVYAYVSPAMTRSMPPQANAFVVLCNIPADFGVPTYAQVQKVTRQEDGSVDALVSGDVVLHLNDKTELMAYGTKQVPALADIKPGTMVLSWYRVVAESMPAQAAPTKVLVFPYHYDGYVSAAPGALSVNGTQVALSDKEASFVHEGKLMVPVRKLAEALGCTVLWDAKTPNMVTVEKDGAAVYTVTIGGDTMTVDGDMVFTLATPAQAREQVTFVCMDDLLTAHSVKYESGNNLD